MCQIKFTSFFTFSENTGRLQLLIFVTRFWSKSIFVVFKLFANKPGITPACRNWMPLATPMAAAILWVQFNFWPATPSADWVSVADSAGKNIVLAIIQNKTLENFGTIGQREKEQSIATVNYLKYCFLMFHLVRIQKSGILCWCWNHQCNSQNSAQEHKLNGDVEALK